MELTRSVVVDANTWHQGDVGAYAGFVSGGAGASSSPISQLSVTSSHGMTIPPRDESRTSILLANSQLPVLSVDEAAPAAPS
jgi:hypothetical protein